ncbi:3-dehydroquinate synthase [bacterium]|nr:3-dehydroquinate synthase [bacterium]
MTDLKGVRNIILTGFMGTGKSTVGRRLAQLLGWRCVDTDAMIEQQAGKTISKIFEEDGEPAFREIESRIARNLESLEHYVIATGGGLVLRAENLAALERAGKVVLLEASAETIHERTKRHAHRPLLRGADPLGNIRRLLEQRREAYGRIRLRVPTDKLTHEQVVQNIIDVVAASADENVVRVNLGDRSYSIRIGQGWIDQLGAELAKIFKPRPCALVTNPEIGKLWGARVIESLSAAGYRITPCEIPEGEENKSLATVSMIYDRMLAERHSRQSGVIALGGGIVGDISGFAAATFLRGVPFIQLPTTLLAMVDSSVGGKTGVNHPAGKNLIGAFWQPTFVGIELDFLKTLPDAELRAGMAEVIKYGVIADARMFDDIEANIEAALARDPEVLARLIRRSCEIKADVVARDEREGGLRAILNFGHTFGHAAEKLTGYHELRHGEAVAMGMVAACKLAARRKMISEGDAARVEKLIERAGLPTHMPTFPIDEYWRAMGADKKVRDGKIRFVLPVSIGAVGIYNDITIEEVTECINQQ